MQNASKRDLWLLPDEKVQKEEWERGWGRELMLGDPYSVQGFGIVSQSWTESFFVVGAALWIVG